MSALDGRRILNEVGGLMILLGFLLVQKLSVEGDLTTRLEEGARGLSEQLHCRWLMFKHFKRRLFVLDCDRTASLGAKRLEEVAKVLVVRLRLPRDH